MPAMSEQSPGSPTAQGAGSNCCRCGEAEIRLAQDLLFFAYRDFTNVADGCWRNSAWAAPTTGHCISSAAIQASRCPACLAILRITKQRLARVLNTLVDEGYVGQAPGYEDRRLRLLTLTEKGKALEQRLFDAQREGSPRRIEPPGRRRCTGSAVMRAMMDRRARAYMDGTGSAEDA